MYERALDYWPNHGSAIVGLSNLLLDVFDQKSASNEIQALVVPITVVTPAAANGQMTQSTDVASLASQSQTGGLGLTVNPRSAMQRTQTGNSSVYHDANSIRTDSLHQGDGDITPVDEASEAGGFETTKSKDAADCEASPEQLDRLAARDRAYFLLSTLTKLGAGWDYPEAWSGLARAYEASGQTEKAKEMLWWCVELEDSRPLRGWEVVGWV
jgi:hypothetical protein